MLLFTLDGCQVWSVGARQQLSGMNPNQMKSPHRVCNEVMPANAAVSVRNTRGPSEARVTSRGPGLAFCFLIKRQKARPDPIPFIAE